MKVSELEGVQLDYWVARALGYRFWLEERGQRDRYRMAVVQWAGKKEPFNEFRNPEAEKHRYTEVFSFDDLRCGFYGDGIKRFSTEWACGGPIIEREHLVVWPYHILDHEDRSNGVQQDYAAKRIGMPDPEATGPSYLIAAMRAFVVSKFGDVVTDGPRETKDRHVVVDLSAPRPSFPMPSATITIKAGE